MRARYTKYFLNHVLLLEDGLATYYVQESISSDEPIPGIALKSFFDHSDAVDWIMECVSYEHDGIRNLRCFLNENAPRPYHLHQMDDHEVMDEAARVIMEQNHPVVIRPMFEPPELQSDLIDIIHEVKHSEPPPLDKNAEPSQYYQFKQVGKYTYDENIALNILKILPNAANDLWNQGVDLANVVLHDAQYINDKGVGDYLEARSKTEWHWLKNAARQINDLVKDGPRQVMNTITSMDLQTIKDFFGSACYAENWEAAVQIGIAIFLTERPKTSMPKSTGASTPGKAKAKKPKPPQQVIGGSEAKAGLANEPKPVEIKTTKKGALEPEAGLKTATTSRVLVENQPKSLKRVTSSGAKLVANPEKTTTVLGRYGDDMKDVLGELDYPKTLDFGEKKGGFNVLNTPDDLYKNADQFWDEYNKPFLDKAIDRGDDIVMATKPQATKLIDLDTGELTGFGREFEYLKSKGYEYDSITNMMVRR